jgi:hypothetical protein
MGDKILRKWKFSNDTVPPTPPPPFPKAHKQTKSQNLYLKIMNEYNNIPKIKQIPW